MYNLHLVVAPVFAASTRKLGLFCWSELSDSTSIKKGSWTHLTYDRRWLTKMRGEGPTWFPSLFAHLLKYTRHNSPFCWNIWRETTYFPEHQDLLLSPWQVIRARWVLASDTGLRTFLVFRWERISNERRLTPSRKTQAPVPFLIKMG